MTNNQKITKAEAYDLLAGTIAKAFVRGIDKIYGSEFERGQIRTVMNLLGVVKEIDERIIKFDELKEV